MYEPLVAARTDEKLRATLQHVLTEYAANIYDIARALLGADQFPEETFAALVAILTNTFEVAALVRPVLPQPDIEDTRIQVLAALLSGG